MVKYNSLKIPNANVLTGYVPMTKIHVQLRTCNIFFLCERRMYNM